MKKADSILIEKVIENQISLLRFTAGERKKVLAILDQLQKELQLKLLNDLTTFSKARVNKLLKESEEAIATAYKKKIPDVDFLGLAQHEATATASSFAAIGLDASLPSEAVLKALVNGSLIDGAPSSAWWAKQSDDLSFRFANQVRQGIMQGETLQQIIIRIAGSKKLGTPGIMDISRRNASALVHTSIQQVANDARLATFKANEDIVKGVRQVSTLDGHTSTVCIAYSGACWDLDGKPIMGTKLAFNGGTPRHFNCRSVLVPITKTYRELGVDVDEVPTGTRASDQGQIRSDITFSEFLKGKSEEYVDNLLGKGRAELWRNGTITLQDLLAQNGRPLPLEQLRNL
jgi:hypothetical protein